jgi:hypothetical protein
MLSLKEYGQGSTPITPSNSRSCTPPPRVTTSKEETRYANIQPQTQQKILHIAFVTLAYYCLHILLKNLQSFEPTLERAIEAEESGDTISLQGYLGTQVHHKDATTATPSLLE